jgi:tetratricopeptide (TPR) repeat protein
MKLTHLAFIFMFVYGMQSNAQTAINKVSKTEENKQAHTITEDEADNLLRASHFFKQQMYDEALFHFNKITTIAPENPFYHYEKGTTLLHLNNFDDAHHSFKNTLSLKHDYANAHLMLGFLYAKQNKIDSALLSYEKAYLYEENRANKLSNKLVMITLLDKNNRLADAQKHIADALSLHLTDELLLFYEGKLQNKTGHYEEAIITLNKAINLLETIEKNEKLHVTQITHNIVTLHHKHSMGEDDAKYYFELYKSYFYTKQYAEAQKLLKKAYFEPYTQALDEMNVNYLYDVALAYHKVYQFGKSKFLLSKIIALLPTFTAAHRLNTQIKDEESDKTVYISQLRKSITYIKQKGAKVKMLNLLLPAEMFKGNYENVINIANELLQIRATDHNAMFMKALAFDKLNKQSEAIAILQKALNLHTLSLEVRATYAFALGLIYEKSHNRSLTLAAFKQSNYFYFKHAVQYELGR